MLERLQLLQDCARGLKELHERNVVHGDLVSEAGRGREVEGDGGRWREMEGDGGINTDRGELGLAG